MATGKHNISRDMPAPARLIAAAVGLVLLVIGAVVLLFWAFRPLTWGLVWLGFGAVGLGGDLLYGGARGKWPVTVECCIHMAQ
jgi:hypothetical protein